MATKLIVTTLPTKSSAGNAWITWHKALKSRFGKKTADLLFLSAFEKRGSTAVVTEQMADYFSTQGITLDQTSISKLKGIVSDTTDFFSDIAKAGMITTYVVGGVLALSFGIFAINIARTANAGTLTKLAGR